MQNLVLAAWLQREAVERGAERQTEPMQETQKGT